MINYRKKNYGQLSYFSTNIYFGIKYQYIISLKKKNYHAHFLSVTAKKKNNDYNKIHK